MASPEHILERARTLHLAGDPARAIPLYLKGLAGRPKLAPARFLYGMALAQLGRPAAAVEQLRQAVSLAPGELAFVAELSRVERILGNYQAAVEAWIRASGSGRIEARLGLAECWAELHRPAEAIAALEGAQRPDSPDVLVSLARLLERSGEVSRAGALAAAALQTGPLRDDALLVLARVAQRAGNRDEQERLLTDVITRSAGSLAAGLAYLDLGGLRESQSKYAEAMEHFRAGKGLLKSLLPSAEQDPSPMLELVGAARRTPLPAGRQAPAQGSPSPVFLVGFPRTGTTLLEQILAAHPQFVTTDELPLIQSVRDVLQEGFAGRMEYPRWVPELTAQQIGRAARSYHDRAAWLVGPSLQGRRLIDKQPLNIINLALIRRLFPDAPIVVMIRDPRDTCLSCFAQPMMRVPAFYDLEDTARLYAAITDLWVHQRASPGLRAIEVRYESLVRDTPAEARRIAEFLGVPWSETMLDHVSKARGRSISTPSYQDAARPVYATAVARWRHYEGAFARLEPILRPALSALGYD